MLPDPGRRGLTSGRNRGDGPQPCNNMKKDRRTGQANEIENGHSDNKKGCTFQVQPFFNSKSELFRGLNGNLAELLHQLRKLQSRLAGTGAGSLVVLLYLSGCIGGKYLEFGIDLFY